MNELSDNLEAFLHEQYCVSLSNNQVISDTYVMADLLDDQKKVQIMNRHANVLDDPPLAVVGSLFAKRFSVYCMAALSSISLFDKQLPFSPDQIQFSIKKQAQMMYQINRNTILTVTYQNASERQQRIKDYIDHIQKQLVIIIESVSSYTRIHPTVMWSLISHNLHNLYLRLNEKCMNTVFEQRLPYILQDRALLTDLIPTKRLTERFKYYCHPEQTDTFFYVRKHCCLAFKLNNSHGYCLTCPRISDLDRNELISKKI